MNACEVVTAFPDGSQTECGNPAVDETQGFPMCEACVAAYKAEGVYEECTTAEGSGCDPVSFGEDPGDSAALECLRCAIDDHLPAYEPESEAGDYEGVVRKAAAAVKRSDKLAAQVADLKAELRLAQCPNPRDPEHGGHCETCSGLSVARTRRLSRLERELEEEQVLNAKLEDKARVMADQVERWMVVATTRESKCETCDGTGIMEVLVALLPPDEREEYDAEPCAECGGTGRGGVAALLQEDRTRRIAAESEVERLRTVIRTGGAAYRLERAAMGIPGGIDADGQPIAKPEDQQ